MGHLIETCMNALVWRENEIIAIAGNWESAFLRKDEDTGKLMEKF